MSKEQEVNEANSGINVNMKFPKGTSPEVVKQAMNSVKDITERETTKVDSMVEQRKIYEKEGKRRWICKVNSLRKGVKTFETTYPDPSRLDNTIPIRGKCGVRIEDGLPKYVIDALQYDAHFETEEVETNLNGAGLALAHKQVRIPHYQVEVYDEIKKPKVAGTIGKITNIA